MVIQSSISLETMRFKQDFHKEKHKIVIIYYS